MRYGSLITVSTCILHRWAARGQVDEREGRRPHLQHGLEGSREPRLHEMAGICCDHEQWLRSARPHTEDEARVLSHFQCADGSTEYIEPLTGVARHPFARVGCKRASTDWTSGLPSEYPLGVDIINSSYLVLPNACNSKRARRALFFDMGCGIDRGNTKTYNKTTRMAISRIPLSSLLTYSLHGAFTSTEFSLGKRSPTTLKNGGDQSRPSCAPSSPSSILASRKNRPKTRAASSGCSTRQHGHPTTS